MTCREFIGFLLDYFEGGLPAEEASSFDEHLAGCASCVAYLKTYAETIRAGKASLAEPDEPVPPEVPEELVKAILAARKRTS